MPQDNVLPPVRSTKLRRHRPDDETRRQFALRNFLLQFLPHYQGGWTATETIYEVWLLTGGRELRRDEFWGEMLEPLGLYIVEKYGGVVPRRVRRRDEDGRLLRGLSCVSYRPKRFRSFDEQDAEWKAQRMPRVGEGEFEEFAGYDPTAEVRHAELPSVIVPAERDEDNPFWPLPPLWTTKESE